MEFTLLQWISYCWKTSFTVIPVWIFIICGQLYLFYAKKLIEKLNFVYLGAKNIQCQVIITQRTFDILQSLKQLYLAADLLHRHFSTILMVNCFVTFTTMFTATYFVIEFIPSGYAVVFLDSSDVVDSFIRFWLICHTSDLIRETVITFTIWISHHSLIISVLTWIIFEKTTECISVLRNLRDTKNTDVFRECNKVS